jgi:hypothetical protein
MGVNAVCVKIAVAVVSVITGANAACVRIVVAVVSVSTGANAATVKTAVVVVSVLTGANAACVRIVVAVVSASTVVIAVIVNCAVQTNSVRMVSARFVTPVMFVTLLVTRDASIFATHASSLYSLEVGRMSTSSSAHKEPTTLWLVNGKRRSRRSSQMGISTKACTRESSAISNQRLRSTLLHHDDEIKL